jgi:hypothetical protein
MRRFIGTCSLAALIIWGGLAGCQRSVVREKPLPDPLLTSKKPIEGKPHITEANSGIDEDLPPPPPAPPMEQGRPVAGSDVPVVQLLRTRATP